jgi:hypothetical protein
MLLAHIVARRLGVSPRTVRWWAETDRIRARRRGVKLWEFAEPDVETKRVTVRRRRPRMEPLNG